MSTLVATASNSQLWTVPCSMQTKGGLDNHRASSSIPDSGICESMGSPRLPTMLQHGGRVCEHPILGLSSSSHAAKARYRRPSSIQRTTAARGKDVQGPRQPEDTSQETYPAPLVLPGDDLACDPEYPAQSFEEWLDEEDRNPVTEDRKILYVASSPTVTRSVGFMNAWSTPHVEESCDGRIPMPQTQDIVDYLAAFYHGLSVRLLPASTLRYTSWDAIPSKAAKCKARKVAAETPEYVGLAASKECIRVRTRASVDGIYTRQLNLDDLLDTAIEMLPEDAFALLMIVDHDLYEDDEDTFVCGRAYGGSRVAVVSTARYNPTLDHLQSVERHHAWPASHCKAYMDACCANASARMTKQKVRSGGSSTSGPLRAAVSQYRHRHHPAMLSADSTLLSGMWLGRICRTTSHELGHCFGIDHCIYYACVMQGSGSLSEDVRQPPYVCPVDLTKILHATGARAADRDHALIAFCDKPDNYNNQVFSPLAVWIKARYAGQQ